MRKHVQLIFAVTTLVTTSGCLGISRHGTPPSWPKPTSAAHAKQFDGVFSNRSIDRATGQPGDQTAELFDFLSGQGHSHGRRGTRVEVRSSPDGKTLHVRLLDEQRNEIDSASLHSGTDFELSGGSLIIHGPFSGAHADSGNIATGIQCQSGRLYVSSTHDLLGKKHENSAGLLFYFIPFYTTTKEWMLWPNQAFGL